MPDADMNPITGHLLNLVQHKQQAEAAKLALLAELNDKAAQMCSSLEVIHEQLAELLERAKER